MTVHVDIELTEAQQQQLEEIARHEDVGLAELIAQLVQSRLEYDARLRRKVQDGRDAIARGEAFSHEEVEARAVARRAELIAKYGET
jgi:predicted transcriptional regulator